MFNSKQFQLLFYIFDLAHYRLSRLGLDSLLVSTVYLTCRQDGTCGLKLVKDNTERPLATKFEELTTDHNCMISYVEIIHDCEPRKVPLELHLVSRDNRFYFKVKKLCDAIKCKKIGRDCNNKQHLNKLLR